LSRRPSLPMTKMRKRPPSVLATAHARDAS
jgi:hypothetical protein